MAKGECKADPRTLRILENDEYPIQVTAALPMDDLSKWIKHFSDQGIEISVKQWRGNRYMILRKLTEKEKEECRNGKWWISGKSFRSQILDDYRKTKHYHEK
jgi:hypothetical protein